MSMHASALWPDWPGPPPEPKPYDPKAAAVFKAQVALQAVLLENEAANRGLPPMGLMELLK